MLVNMIDHEGLPELLNYYNYSSYYRSDLLLRFIAKKKNRVYVLYVSFLMSLNYSSFVFNHQ